MHERTALGALLIAAAVVLTGCSNAQKSLEEYLPKREPKYKSSTRLPPLEVPPDLSSGTINESMKVPELKGTTYSTYNNGEPNKAAASRTSGVLPDYTKVRVERRGDKRWLVVEAKPGEVWPRVRDFWLEQGFILKMEDPSIGIMETDWAEERTDLQPGAISRFLNSLSSALYGSATRDKFRTRLERGADRDTTEVYVSHRGAEQVVTNSNPNQFRNAEDKKVWQPRPADPELEAEMLNRMMVYFGVSEEHADKLMAQGPKQPDRARMIRESSGASVLSLDEDFSRAWRRTGLALDRVGFTVEDRDRSRGLYFVRYVDPDRENKSKESFFSKLKFWGNDDTPKQNEYLISLIGGESSTQVVILNKQGERDTSETADRILGLLHEQLR